MSRLAGAMEGRPPCSSLDRQREAECGPLSLLALHPDPPAVPLDDPLRDREAEPAARRLLAVPVTLEDVRHVLRSDADADIRHGEPRLERVRLRAQDDLGTTRGELDRVPDEV